MPISRPALIAWYRNTECMASRTGSLPRNENDRLEIPPDTSDPGHRRLISAMASMVAFANSSCSSMPVATGRTLGSKTMFSGPYPASWVSRR